MISPQIERERLTEAIKVAIDDIASAFTRSVAATSKIAHALVDLQALAQPNADDELLTANEAADVLHLDVSHIHELARTRRLECVEIKGTGEKMIRRFSRRALARYVRPAHKDVA